MNRHFTTTAALACALGWSATPALAEGTDSADGGTTQNFCAAKTRQTYGFQCTGQVQLVPGLGLEPVTFAGTVTADRNALFAGYGTFNSSFGAARQRLVGQALFQDRSCFGRIHYRVFLQLGGGSEAELAPLDIDFSVVNGGKEILGTPTALAGVTGAAVPRLTCRLVKVGGFD
jgi:hypothetical protein